MIDEKKLIEELRKDQNGLLLESEKESFAYDVLEHVIEIVNELPQADKWIPCEERLPETSEVTKSSEVVLVCGYDKANDFSWQAMGFYVKTESIKRWFFAECKNTDKPIDWIDIVAWQPLPQPYKKEGAENG